jgi:hypothetical protein
MCVNAKTYSSTQLVKYKTLIINHLYIFFVTMPVKKPTLSATYFSAIHKSTAN